jgi:hypothetical protein
MRDHNSTLDHENCEDRVTYMVNPELNGCCIDAGAFLKIYQLSKEKILTLYGKERYS